MYCAGCLWEGDGSRQKKKTNVVVESVEEPDKRLRLAERIALFGTTSWATAVYRQVCLDDDARRWRTGELEVLGEEERREGRGGDGSTWQHGGGGLSGVFVGLCGLDRETVWFLRVRCLSKLSYCSAPGLSSCLTP
jgi:hypothetical protein